ncbi:hypothetical protein BDV29DRAFT_156406 [Aspergillus leporis]|uniref:Uncharacterized protein n=1 Tax=Aspergillus leporis TaxID=41062 RepID=A0A5N5X1H5_9EURO|nr:hypothetical protein BDV29DRAFT_156406 [Aspergillus leporis]
MVEMLLSRSDVDPDEEDISSQTPLYFAAQIGHEDIVRLLHVHGANVDYDDYRDFIQKQTNQFELVFLVLGNHKFYNGTFTAGLEKARQLEQEPSLNGRLVLLHQKRYNIPGPGVTILGCTLWSKLPPDSAETVRSRVQDFKQIEDWTAHDHSVAHVSDLAWLLEEMRQVDGEAENSKSVLVATHHAPSLQRTSSPQYAQSPWRFAFATDVLSQVSSRVRIWLFGHTHYTTDSKK